MLEVVKIHQVVMGGHVVKEGLISFISGNVNGGSLWDLVL